MKNLRVPRTSSLLFRPALRVAQFALCILHGAFAMAAADCLFENARSDWRISLREDADPAEVFAAETLQTNIVKISGALLPIVRENTPAAPKALVVSPFLPKGPDDLVSIRTDGGCILLEGNSPRATIYASCRFLQDQLGARWYWPGKDGEYMPRLRRYEIPVLNWSGKPAFRYRDLSQCGYHGHVPTEHWLARLAHHRRRGRQDVRRTSGLVLAR